MRGIQAKVVDQGLGEALHRELRRRIGGVGGVGADGGPEAVDAGGVDDVALLGGDQHRQEGAAAQIDPAPADIEGSLPGRPAVGDHAAAAGDAGVVEQQVDVIGLVLLGDLVPEALQGGLVGDIGDMGGDAHDLGDAVGGGQRDGLGHVRGRDVAHGHVAALGHQLAGELAAHAGAAAGDDRRLPWKSFMPSSPHLSGALARL